MRSKLQTAPSLNATCQCFRIKQQQQQHSHHSCVSLSVVHPSCYGNLSSRLMRGGEISYVVTLAYLASTSVVNLLGCALRTGESSYGALPIQLRHSCPIVVTLRISWRRARAPTGAVQPGSELLLQ
eukprot:TRINITY_DN100_c0_g1_i1.p1 TRINITY_DN100_c0_g1~~TRINITY_DN100_c0_g1_i1.p1  ORF type:complete len:126 (+),score=4.94 TRINITY_DN100_c0_g1_i1:276-653(+)